MSPTSVLPPSLSPPPAHTQKQLLSKLRGEVPEALAAQRNRAAGICFDLAEYNNKLRKADKVRQKERGEQHCACSGPTLPSSLAP